MHKDLRDRKRADNGFSRQLFRLRIAEGAAYSAADEGVRGAAARDLAARGLHRAKQGARFDSENGEIAAAYAGQNGGHRPPCRRRTSAEDQARLQHRADERRCAGDRLPADCRRGQLGENADRRPDDKGAARRARRDNRRQRHRQDLSAKADTGHYPAQKRQHSLG